MSTKLEGILQQPPFVGKEARIVIWNVTDFDRGREIQLGALASLQTVLAVFPRRAFQSAVACDGLIETKVGFAQTRQARFRKEVIRPAMSPW